MASQDEQQQQQATGQSERPSRPKSKAAKAKDVATPVSSMAASSINANSPAEPCEPLFNYLVPMNICVQSPAGQQHQPQVDEQPVVESVAWALLNRLSGQIEATFSLKVGPGASKEAAASAGQSCSLSEAIQEVEKSLKDKKCALVTCGPVPLRQHLHPIAKRLKVELGLHFSQYVDLLKEFDRCTFANNLTGRQVARAQAASATASACPCWPACSLDSGDSTGCDPKFDPASDKENLQEQRQRATSFGHQQVSSAVVAVGDQSAATPPLQQQQPISQGSRKRFEEILKFLFLEPAAGVSRKSSKPATCSSATTNSSGKQCNCLSCSQALVEASCSIVTRLLREGHSFNRLERIKRRVEVGLCETSAHEAEQRVVRARGLPWQASEQDIADFFTGLNIAKGGVGLCLSRQGRRNGEALIQFESREHRNLALSRHKHFMGNRYIEVYRASGDDFQSVAAGYNNKAEAFISKGAQFIVRMRGLPFTCTAKQVVDFFASSDARTKACEVFAGEEGVLFVRNQDEKPTGDAFVLFATDEHTRRAIAKHHQNIGTRYVELFRSTVSEVQQVLSVSMGPSSVEEQAGSRSLNGKQQAAAPKARQQTLAEKGKSATSKSPPAAKSTSYTSQLESRSAFPALSEKPVARQRPDAATYAQVAHSNRSSVGDNSPVSKQVAEQESIDSAAGKELPVVASDEKAQEGQTEPQAQSDSTVAEGRVEEVKSDESSEQGGNEAQALTSACQKLTLTPTSDQTSTSGSSGSPSASHSPSSCSASSASAPVATPNLVRSPISSSCSSSDHDSSSSNLSYKQASTANYSPHHHQSSHHQTGFRRYQNQSQHYHQHRGIASRYAQNYVSYHPTMMQHQQQAMMYSPELQSMQTTIQQQQQHPASMTHYSTPHYQQMAYTTSQTMQAAAVGQFDPSQQLPPPPYSANPMQHQRAQQVYATTTVAAAGTGADPALMSRCDCIRLRGLPFGAQIDDVLQFLGKHSESILYQGVHMVFSAQGQPTGEAIIQMASSQAASAAAQEAHRRVMSVGKKQRYIEVIPSSIEDLKPTLGYGLAAFVASRAAATYGMHPMHYATYAAQMGHIDPLTSHYHPGLHHQHQHLPYSMEPAAIGSDCYPNIGEPAAVASIPSSASSETGASPSPEQSSALASKQASSDSDTNAKEAEPATSGTPKPTASAAGKPQDKIQEVEEADSEATAGSRASISSSNSTQPITTTATSSSQPIAQHQQQHQLQQQQALMAAAQAAAYYPILYYYPPPQQQHQPILAAAAPSANLYH